MSKLTDFIGYPLVKSFQSAEQTITSAGALTIAHGLGVVPSVVMGFLKCVTAEHGYSIGDVLCIALGSQSTSTSDSYGAAVVADATNLTVRYGSAATTCFAILDKTTGALALATNANWTFSLRAFA